MRQFPLRPIRSAADHRRALAIVADLSARSDEHLSDGEVDYLQALARFVADYERAHVLAAMEKATPLEILRHLVEEHGMTPADWGRCWAAVRRRR